MERFGLGLIVTGTLSGIGDTFFPVATLGVEVCAIGVDAHAMRSSNAWAAIVACFAATCLARSSVRLCIFIYRFRARPFSCLPAGKGTSWGGCALSTSASHSRKMVLHAVSVLGLPSPEACSQFPSKCSSSLFAAFLAAFSEVDLTKEIPQIGHAVFVLLSNKLSTINSTFVLGKMPDGVNSVRPLIAYVCDGSVVP